VWQQPCGASRCRRTCMAADAVVLPKQRATSCWLGCYGHVLALGRRGGVSSRAAEQRECCRAATVPGLN
jgi:hypothetical protein